MVGQFPKTVIVVHSQEAMAGEQTFNTSLNVIRTWMPLGRKPCNIPVSSFL